VLSIAGCYDYDKNNPKPHKITYSGSGCPEGSVVSSISNNQKAITFKFSDYFVDLDNGKHQGRRLESRAKCDIKLLIEASKPSLTYAFFSLKVKGYATLDRGVFGKYETKVSGGGEDFYFRDFKVRGYFDDDFMLHEKVPRDSLSWAKCGRAGKRQLEIKTSFLIKGKSYHSGFMAMDAEFDQTYGLVWKMCPRR